MKVFGFIKVSDGAYFKSKDEFLWDRVALGKVSLLAVVKTLPSSLINMSRVTIGMSGIEESWLLMVQLLKDHNTLPEDVELYNSITISDKGSHSNGHNIT
jgi:hypothetical protein